MGSLVPGWDSNTYGKSLEAVGPHNAGLPRSILEIKNEILEAEAARSGSAPCSPRATSSPRLGSKPSSPKAAHHVIEHKGSFWEKTDSAILNNEDVTKADLLGQYTPQYIHQHPGEKAHVKLEESASFSTHIPPTPPGA